MNDRGRAAGARRSLVVGTAGHIDHGKSALVQALTGTDPDRLQEEKARGITIDLGFAHADVGDVTVAFVDVPGHEKFVRNMLAGATGIDAVLLVVAADASVMPQTREHFEICRLLGIRHGVVAITKTDLADAEAVDLAALEVRELMAASALAGAPIVPVSARTGAGLDDLRRALAALPAAARQARDGVVRLPVDRVFTMKGFGTVVTGTLVSGQITEGDELVALPGDRRVRVRGLQAHGQAHQVVAAPHRIALNLGGVDSGDLSRGVTIATADALTVSARADLEIELLPGARPLRHGARVRVHQGTSEIAGRVSIAAIRGGGERDVAPVRPGQAGVEIAPGGGGFVRVRFDGPAVLTWGDRVVIRALTPPVTIAGGVVMDPAPPASGIRRSAAVDRFQRLRTVDGAVRVWLAESQMRGLSAADLVRRGGVSPAQARSLVVELVAMGEAVDVDGRVYASEVVSALDARMRDELASHHRRAPLDEGVARSTLRESVAARGTVALFDARVAHLVATGMIRGTERLALAGHRAQISGAEAELQQQLLARARAAGLGALDAATLARGLGAAPAAVEHAFRQLVKDQQLVRLESMYADAAALATVADDLRRAKREAGELKLDVAAIKERYGLTRKHAIPLLEWLDRARVTRRIGDVRVVL